MDWLIKDAEAQYKLGLKHYKGSGITGAGGTPVNREKAMKWFTKAALQGHAEAQRHMGDAYCHDQVYQNYLEPEVILKNNNTALEWYIKAASQGDELAIYMLGLLIGNGTLVPESDKVAAEWLTLASEEMGLSAAQVGLEIMLETGRAAPRIVNNTFKVLGAGMGKIGVRDSPAIYLDIRPSDGSTSRIWNNWAKGKASRLTLAKSLIGKEITYDTWDSSSLYRSSDKWFYRVYEAPNIT